LKYVAIAVVGFYAVVALIVVAVFIAIGYQFTKGISNLGRDR